MNFFFSKIFLYENIFPQIFFWWKFLLSNFFWRKFFFSQKYFCQDFFHNIFANFFCIWCLRNNVFCGIFYSKFCLLRFLLFCNFGVRKKNCKFFCDFFSAMNVNTKFENVSFLKKSKIFSNRTFKFLHSLLGK